VTGLPDPSVADATARLSTPRRLRRLRMVLYILCAVMLVAGETTLETARRTMRTVAKDSAPSIIAATEIGADLADLDANLANLLLGEAVHRLEAEKTIEERRVKVSRRLVEAAQNITYGEGEKVPITRLVEELGRYLEITGEVRHRARSGGPETATAAYLQASLLMHEALLPAAAELDRVNRRHMDEAYSTARNASGGAEVLAGGCGGALVLGLVYLQWLLYRRMRRVFNPALLLATLLSLVFTVFLLSRFHEARHHLKEAKEDAFHSIHQLLLARALAYDANGDESRLLLDSSGGHDAAFHSKVAKLTSVPRSTHLTRVLRLGHLRVENVPITGHFAEQLRNITFPGEMQATLDMMDRFTEYHVIDQRIRELHRQGRQRDAVELCIGIQDHQSNAAFARFDRALDKVLQINRKVFDQVVTASLSSLREAEILDPLFAVAIAALVYFGLRPRLREYA
jgi:hypothetical protein